MKAKQEKCEDGEGGARAVAIQLDVEETEAHAEQDELCAGGNSGEKVVLEPRLLCDNPRLAFCWSPGVRVAGEEHGWTSTANALVNTSMSA